MKLSLAIALVIAVKVNADCFSTKLGYPCCKNTKDVAYIDDDGQWGYENDNWCGLGKGNDEQCTGQNDGYPCCNTCNVTYTDAQGDWSWENDQWCGIKKNCRDDESPNDSNIPNVLPQVNGQKGRTTRYWDCCVASCSWYENTLASHAVNACDKDGKTIFPNFNYEIGNICDPNTRQKGYMCNNNQPWALTDNLSYGFAAAAFTSGKQKEWCCSCYRLQFTNKEVKDKQMVVQVTNTGYDLSNNHFDIQMPGGGVGYYNGCQAQWGTGPDGWGERYGGVKSISDCNQLPSELQDACKWRFNWFKNADNPEIVFERVQCPTELTDITGCIPVDDASQKKLPWVN